MLAFPKALIALKVRRRRAVATGAQQFRAGESPYLDCRNAVANVLSERRTLSAR